MDNIKLVSFLNELFSKYVEQSHDDLYYFATKKVKIKKEDIYNEILEYFQINQVENVPINTIYKYLKNKLNLSSLGLEKLEDLLGVKHGFVVNISDVYKHTKNVVSYPFETEVLIAM